jgi:tetratricopeptide (TPR) repeat protein
MSEPKLRYPKLDKFYQQFLNEESSADFVQSVSLNYSPGTLERLATSGQRMTRRSAILALGFVGSFDNNEVMGLALSDSDRAVRMLADHGIRQLWHRQGSAGQQSALQHIYQMVEQSRMNEAIEEATCLIAANDELGEAYSQRAIAYSAVGNYESALIDCREALQCNRFHFPAAIGLAHCCLQINETSGALASFRLALNINPDLDNVRRQVAKLERMFKNEP